MSKLQAAVIDRRYGNPRGDKYVSQTKCKPPVSYVCCRARVHFRHLRRATASAATRTSAAAARSCSGDFAELQTGHDGTAEEAGRRRLADGPADLRRLGVQSTRSDHDKERRQAPARMG